MINNDTNTNPTITLTNAHGTYTVEVDALELTMLKTKNMPIRELRIFGAGLCGYDEADLLDAFRANSRIEVNIAITDSGNF